MRSYWSFSCFQNKYLILKILKLFHKLFFFSDINKWKLYPRGPITLDNYYINFKRAYSYSSLFLRDETLLYGSGDDWIQDCWALHREGNNRQNIMFFRAGYFLNKDSQTFTNTVQLLVSPGLCLNWWDRDTGNRSL